MSDPTADWALGELAKRWPPGKYPGLSFTAYPELAAHYRGKVIARGEQWKAVDALLRCHDFSAPADTAPPAGGEVPWAMLALGFPSLRFRVVATDEWGAETEALNPAAMWKVLADRVGAAVKNTWPERRQDGD